MKSKLTQLNAKFLRYSTEPKGIEIKGLIEYDITILTCDERIEEVPTIQEANGISFDCPHCAQPHRVICWSTAVPYFASPALYRWKIEGTSLSDVSVILSFENEMCIERLNSCDWRRSILFGEVQ